MSEESTENNLPAAIANAISGVPKSLIPASVKALDRLIGASIDIPAAWLAQRKAKIDAQTQAYTAVEAAIAKAVSGEAGADPEIVERALNVLVRKEYRKERNREAVAVAMIDTMQASAESPQVEDAPPPMDDDWLNVFERYAEDASTERMQKLWGRVLAGEVRSPGKFSMRTLRFLSEFSQADALSFASFCESAIGDFALAKLVRPDGTADIRDLMYLESAGLIQGTSGSGLALTFNFNAAGYAFLREDNLVLALQGTPQSSIQIRGMSLTPLGQELITLLPDRDVRAAARRIGLGMRTPEIKSALIGVIGAGQKIAPIEVLWQEEEAPGTNG